MMVLRKKRLIPIVLLLLVAAAGYFNLKYIDTLPEETTQMASGEPHLVSSEETAVSVSAEETQSVMAADYFTTAKADREASRAEATETLKALLNTESATPEAKAQAEKELSQTAERMEQEAAIESQILAKGYTNAVVYISAENVTVIVESDGITAADAAIIQELALNETGRNPEEIRIIEVH